MSTHHRDNLDSADESRRRAALGGKGGICRALNPGKTHMCDLDAGHDGDHDGFELPTIVIDEDSW